MDYTYDAQHPEDYAYPDNVYDSSHTSAALPDSVDSYNPFPAVDYGTDYAIANRDHPE